MQLQDYARWEQVAAEPPRWDGRNAEIAALIPAGCSVIDLGAGARTLSEYLPQTSPYQAVDLVPGPGVIRCDFNAGEFPEVQEQFDVAVVSGVLEYLFDPRAFLGRLRGVARSAILTFAARRPGDSLGLRASRGWVAHLFRHELVVLFDELDIVWTVLGEWRGQVIFGLTLAPDAPVLGTPGTVVSPDEAVWVRRLDELAGHLAVHPGTRPADPDLAEWVDAQRAVWSQRLLEAHRARRLQALPGWTWSGDAEEWSGHRDRWAALQAGELAPADLRAWADRQRADRAANTLDVRRVARLDAVAGWTWDQAQADWQTSIAALRTFLEREGHAAVPAEHVEDGVALGAWVTERRQEHATGTLAPAQAATIEGLRGWIWDQAQARWERGFSALSAFAAREGHAQVPRGHREHGIDLSAWLDGQANALAQGWLPPERVQRLQALGALATDADAQEWEREFARLADWARTAGHASPVRGEVARWVAAQRAAHRAGRLDAGRRARLERLDGWAWTDADAEWERAFASLAAFAGDHGHASPSTRQEHDATPIGAWVAEQRAATLDDGRRARLESLPGWAWTAADGGWERRFAALAAYAAERGHALPGADAPALARFVAEQRRAREDGALPALRALRLEGLEAWAWGAPPAPFLRGLRALVAYARRMGDVDVPRGHREGGVVLDRWLERQRRALESGALAPNEERLLSRLVPWADARPGAQTGWQTAYRRLVERARPTWTDRPTTT